MTDQSLITMPLQGEQDPATPHVKLLLVGDQEADLLALKGMLAGLGHPIVAARSAQETFRRLLEEEFALLLLDVAVPGLNGPELAALLQERNEACLTPIIFITAHCNDTESVARSYPAGGVDYLIKPVNPEILRAKVRVFVQLAQARRQLRFENAQRRRAEASLHLLNVEVEQRVAERTAALTRANESLLREVGERKRTEERLQRDRGELASANSRLDRLVQERTARLEDVVSELERFSYAIIHDLRAPLRALEGFASILCREWQGGLTDQRRDYLQRIATSARRMDRLITDALHYSRASRMVPILAPVDTQALLRGILDSYPALQPPKARVQIAGPLPAVLANEAGLTQCFSNLLDNAVKFVAPGKTAEVTIRAEPQNGFVRLWFEDNGIGIPRHSHSRIFEMFQRATSDYEGNGIGLALVRKVAQKMGGRVGVESEPGNGSRFWMDLKAATQKGGQAGQAADARKEVPP